MKSSTLTLFVAVFALLTSLFSSETAWAGKRGGKPSCNPLMDIGCAASPVAYNHKVPGVRYSNGRQRSLVSMKKFYTTSCIEKHGYNTCMVGWNTYCDKRGDRYAWDEAIAGFFLTAAAAVASQGVSLAANAGSSFTPLIGRKGAQEESKCHAERSLFISDYEHARAQKQTDQVVAAEEGTQERLEALLEENDALKQEVKGMSQEFAAFKNAVHDAMKAQQQPTPQVQPIPSAPAPTKPEPATPEGKERETSEQSPVQPDPKAEAPKVEEVPSARPSNDEPRNPSVPLGPPDTDKAGLRQDPSVAFNPTKRK